MKKQCKYCQGVARNSFVYVMHLRGDGCVKVGYARDPKKRARQLRRQFGAPIEVYATVRVCCEFSAMDAEDRAHRSLRGFWSGRGEWFECSAEVAAAAIERAVRR